MGNCPCIDLDSYFSSSKSIDSVPCAGIACLYSPMLCLEEGTSTGVLENVYFVCFIQIACLPMKGLMRLYTEIGKNHLLYQLLQQILKYRPEHSYRATSDFL